MVLSQKRGYMRFQTMILGGMAAAGIGAGCFVRSEYEKECLVTEVAAFRSPKIKGRRRLVFLSDLHDKEFGKDNERLLKAIEEAGPDAILIGGDMMVCKGKPGIEVPVKLISRLAEKYPVYCGNGNHENRMEQETEVYGDQYRRYRKALEEMGVFYLANGSAPLGEDIVVSGADLQEKYYKKRFFHNAGSLEKGYLESRLGEASKERFQILLLHSPMYFEDAARWGADLTLSGHFHGGTIRIPGLGGVMTPQYQFFLPWCAGTFEKKGKYLAVSRGLGTHSINIRFNNKPQIMVIELFPEPKISGTNL